jgi:hypothetical protein
VKVVANSTLLAVEAGASDELLLMIRQSSKDGRYSPSTRMEEVEWQKNARKNYSEWGGCKK